MKRISQLKDEALATLDGNFGKAALATLGFMAIAIAISVFLNLGRSQADSMSVFNALTTGNYSDLMDVSGASPYATLTQWLINFFFLFPLSVGMVTTYRKLFESKGAENTIFSNFFKYGFGKEYLHIVFVMFIYELLILLIFIPIIAIPVLIMAIAHTTFVTVIGILVILFCIVLVSLMYSQVSLIVLDNPELGPTDVMSRSRHLMNGNKWRFFVLGLSFLGWIVLGIVTLGIGYLWLAPYMSTTQAAFYCEIRDAEKQQPE